MPKEFHERIISFMARGEYALIKSVECFADNPEYERKQIIELGFSDNDLLICITEGGETSFVIGAVLESLHHSKRKPYFFCGNPDKDLAKIERIQEVLENTRIN